MSYKEILAKARNSEPSSKAVNTANGKDVNTVSQEPVKEQMVSITIKVPESHRRHYTGKAKMEGVTVTDVLVEALNARFGNPG